MTRKCLLFDECKKPVCTQDACPSAALVHSIGQWWTENQEHLQSGNTKTQGSKATHHITLTPITIGSHLATIFWRELQ